MVAWQSIFSLDGFAMLGNRSCIHAVVAMTVERNSDRAAIRIELDVSEVIVSCHQTLHGLSDPV
jgi:hypothetical protein